MFLEARLICWEVVMRSRLEIRRRICSNSSKVPKTLLTALRVSGTTGVSGLRFWADVAVAMRAEESGISSS